MGREAAAAQSDALRHSFKGVFFLLLFFNCCWPRQNRLPFVLFTCHPFSFYSLDVENFFSFNDSKPATLCCSTVAGQDKRLNKLLNSFSGPLLFPDGLRFFFFFFFF
ncbi:hypothetical protein V8C34DRAFT_286178, partial [Trichoderma compactum]